jgi:ubiquinone/menaquinone biosynthesis C-methylase UbiE
MIINVTPWMFRVLYRLINRFDREKLVIFMNFGYSSAGKDLDLDAGDEKNRYPIQLYRHLTDKVDLTGKEIVEIGCGRGGGLSHTARNSDAASLLGIDIEKTAVEFASREYKEANLSFLKGNAEKIPLPDNSCDVVLNVESSHRYLSIGNFISEVSRILKPGGTFLFTDFRYPYEWAEFRDLLSSVGMISQWEHDITENVLIALRKDTARRLALVRSFAPRILQKGIINFSGCEGSETYRFFEERTYEYKSFLFTNMKPAVTA